MTVRELAAHKPEAPAKGAAVLRWRFRLVCCRIPHGDLLQVTKVMHAFASGGVYPRRAEPHRRDQPNGTKLPLTKKVLSDLSCVWEPTWSGGLHNVHGRTQGYGMERTASTRSEG